MIRIGGMTPLTSIDFPGQLAAVLYLQGCPWRCGYCHNPGLIPARGESHVEWRQVVAFLHRRRGLLDGVVFSGGEPTSQTGLPDAIAQVAGLDYRIGLHTGGMYPGEVGGGGIAHHHLHNGRLQCHARFHQLSRAGAGQRRGLRMSHHVAAGTFSRGGFAPPGHRVAHARRPALGGAGVSGAGQGRAAGRAA